MSASNGIGHDAGIVVEATDIPTNIERLVDTIIQPNLSVSRRSELVSIAKNFCNNLRKVTQVAGREDDFLELIYTALTAIDRGQSQRKTWQFKAPANNPDASISQKTDVPQQEEDPRAEAEALYMSPASSESYMPPPALPPTTKQDSSGVKIPRPDITVGLRLSLLIDALKSKGLGQIEAQDFLKDLQYQQALCSNPLQPVYPLCFPPLVVEGKS
ncbi:MAG: hypothetical protein Q9215_007708 [Flavoplaca cf. flavocitrina]